MKKKVKRLKSVLLKGDFGEVFKGGSIAFVYRVCSMGLSYGILFFISKKLGEEGVGIYNLCLAILGILIMFGCLGFNTSLVRFVSQYRSKNWNYSIVSLYRSTALRTGTLSIVLGLIGFFTAEWAAVEQYESEDLIIPFQMVAIMLPFGVFAMMNVEFIRGLKKVHISEFFRNLELHLLTVIGLIIGVYFGLSYWTPVLYYGIGTVIAAVATGAFVLHFFSQRRSEGLLKPIADEPKFEFRSHFLVSIPMILTSFIQFLNGKIDTLMLGLYTDNAMLGIFTMALKLSIITNFVISSLNTIASPKISELFWSKKMNELNKVVQSSAQLIFLFALPVTAVLLIFPKQILGIVGEQYHVGTRTLQIFAITQMLNSVSGMVAIFLNMTGNQVFFTRLVVIATSINIVLNLLLIPRYGMEGAAIATLISSAFWNIIGARYIYKKFGIRTYLHPKSLIRAIRQS